MKQFAEEFVGPIQGQKTTCLLTQDVPKLWFTETSPSQTWRCEYSSIR